MILLRALALVVLLAVSWDAGGVEPAASPQRKMGALLADLSPEVLESLRSEAGDTGLPKDPAGLLDRIFSAGPVYHFDAGLVGVDTDRRWFETLPPGAPGGPLLELRRWPGDTVLALYALSGEAAPEGGPLLPGSKLTKSEGAASDTTRWDGTLDTALGRRPVAWLERRLAAVSRRLGILLVPGDAGLGRDAADDLMEELLAVADRIELRADAWNLEEGIHPGTTLVLPALGAPPADADERRDTWQVVEGRGFTMGLPPGVRVRRLDEGIPPPREVPAAVLWMRGRFIDRKGERVAVGDGTRAGYLAVISSIDRAWTEGEKAPLAAAGATRLAGEDFSVACEQTGAEAARAERWSEPGFEGQWLVFRMILKGAGIEIGLPVLTGRQSEALFWIPTTFRGAGVPPAPPPVDPAERFGISFAPFTKLDQKRHPGFEGYLTVPGLRLELPRGWFPVTTLRAEDGFPVTLVDGHGKEVGRLLRLPYGSEDLAAKGWVALRRPTPRKPTAVYRRADGARLYGTAEGRGILLVPNSGEIVRGAEWDRLVESATPLRPAVRKTGAGDQGGSAD